MASSYSISKQSFKEKLGRSNVTMDEQFNHYWNNVQQLDEVIERVRNHMATYVDSMKGLCISGHAVADDFKSFYERTPERLTVIAIKYEQIQHGFRTDKISLLERLVNQNVLLRLDELALELKNLRLKVQERDIARKKYDHYLSKIQDLREMSTRAKSKGKDLSVGDLDKLARNEKKFEDARLEYVAVNQLVTKDLWTMWRQRYQILDPVYAEILKIKANFTQALSNQLQAIVPLLKQQMTVELQEEIVPAIFGGNERQQLKRNGSAGNMTQGQGDEEEDGHPTRVLSPGGTTEMDNKKLAARMQIANEKLESDAARANIKAQEKARKAAAKAGKTVPDRNLGPINTNDDDEDDDEDDEDDDEETKRRHAKAKAAKAKAKAEAAAVSTSSTAPTTKTKKITPPPAADDEESEEDSDSELTDSEDEAERQRQKRKAKKKKEKERAAAAAAAATTATSKTKPRSSSNATASTTSLDFLVDVVNQPTATATTTKASKKAAASSGAVDLLSFSPAKPVKSTTAATNPTASLLDFANAPTAAATGTTAKSAMAAAPATTNKKGRLELDSFFGASTASPEPPTTAAVPNVIDPFFNLPSADSAPPVDLFSVGPPTAGAILPPQDLSRQPSLSTTSQQPGLLDDPLFATPLPLPIATSLTPKPATATTKPSSTKTVASKTAAAKKPKKKSRRRRAADDSDSSSSSSDSSEEEEDETAQEEGQPPPSTKRTPSTTLSAAAIAAAVNRPRGGSSENAAAAGGAGDPFDFASHPTPSQREAASGDSSSAASAAELVQSPKKHLAKPPPVSTTAATSFVPGGPMIGGLSDLHLSTSAAAATAASSSSSKTAQISAKSGRTKTSDPLATPTRSPEDYSPTRENYNPHGTKKPKESDPFGGVGDDWGDEDD